MHKIENYKHYWSDVVLPDFDEFFANLDDLMWIELCREHGFALTS